MSEPGRKIARHRDALEGVKHLRQTEPLDPIPGEPISLSLNTAGPLPFDRACCWISSDGQDPAGEASSRVELRPEGVHWDEIAGAYIRSWKGQIPPQSAGTLIRYRLGAQVAGSGRWVFADNQAGDPRAATEFALWVDDDAVPGWAREAVVYQIFVDRFYPGDGVPWRETKAVSGFYGGTLRGVLEKLDYVASLGFNTLWLTPIFPSPSHHGYDTTDYFGVEPRFGTEEDLERLVRAAHARGLRLLLDFAANHVSNQHPAFRDAQRNPDSACRDWFLWRRWPDRYETFYDVRTMPKLNLAWGSPARAHLLDSARYWLERGVDGFRLDHANGPPFDFWVEFRRVCRQANPDCWLFGEVIDTAPVQLGFVAALDGTLDFLLAQALRETFALGTWTLAQLEAFLISHETFFPAFYTWPSFLDNHDMNRFLFAADGDRRSLEIAALVLCTLPSPPIVYYGTEVGLTQERPVHQGERGIFDEARLPMLWGEDQDGSLQDYFRRLIALRRGHPALLEPARHLLHLDADAGTWAYLRGAGPEAVVVAVNTGRTPEVITIHPPVPPSPAARDLLNGNNVSTYGAALEIELRPQRGAFVAA